MEDGSENLAHALHFGKSKMLCKICDSHLEKDQVTINEYFEGNESRPIDYTIVRDTNYLYCPKCGIIYKNIKNSTINKKVLIAICKSDRGFNAYAPDYPGCIAVSETKEEAIRLLNGALKMHMKSMIEDGEELPCDNVHAEIIDVEIIDVEINDIKRII